MQEEDWGMAARNVLERERVLVKVNNPSPSGVFVEWKKKVIIGSLQRIAPEMSREIVLLSTPSISDGSTILDDHNGLIDALRKLDPDREYLYVDDKIVLEGRQNILRKVGNRLTRLTNDQTIYMTAHSPSVVEVG